jgi:hypothetical protein
VISKPNLFLPRLALPVQFGQHEIGGVMLETLIVLLVLLWLLGMVSSDTVGG